MTWNLFVGKESVLDVSGSTRDVGTVVARELENKKVGSKFPLFQKLFDQKASIAVRDLGHLAREISGVYRGLIPIPYPVASYWIEDLEIGYIAKREGNGPLCVFERDKFGIDDEGLYVARGGDLFDDVHESSKIHSAEQHRGQRYFRDFIFAAEGRFPQDMRRFPQDMIDRVTYANKSALLVFERTLSDLSRIAEYARDRRKPIKGPDA